MEALKRVSPVEKIDYRHNSPAKAEPVYRELKMQVSQSKMVMAFKSDYEDIYTEGITRITDIDFEYAEKMGTSVKLFGTSRIKDGRVLAYVAPVMINKTSPLYSVNDVFNGILVKGNMLGTSMFYGSGAGKLPTGSAVVADIIEAAQNLKRNVPMGWSGEKQAIESMDQAQFRFLPQ